MRVLYDNLYRTADSLTATEEDPNYPVTNLATNSDQVLYKPAATGSEVTVENTYPRDVSSFTLGNFYDLSAITISLFDPGASLIYSVSPSVSEFISTDPLGREYNTGIYYLNQSYSNVESVVADLTFNTTAGYIGGAFAGTYLQFPDIAVRPSFGGRQTGGGFKTREGILFDNPGRMLEQFKATIASAIPEDDQAALDFERFMGIGETFYLDRYEGIDTMRPYLANLIDANFSREKHPGISPYVYRNITLSFEECR